MWMAAEWMGMDGRGRRSADRAKWTNICFQYISSNIHKRSQRACVHKENEWSLSASLGKSHSKFSDFFVFWFFFCCFLSYLSVSLLSIFRQHGLCVYFCGLVSDRLCNVYIFFFCSWGFYLLTTIYNYICNNTQCIYICLVYEYRYSFCHPIMLVRVSIHKNGQMAVYSLAEVCPRYDLIRVQSYRTYAHIDKYTIAHAHSAVRDILVVESEPYGSKCAWACGRGWIGSYANDQCPPISRMCLSVYDFHSITRLTRVVC